MRIKILTNEEDILEVIQDGRVRAIRWDFSMDKFILDMDCILEYLGDDIRVVRCWFVFVDYSELLINIDWTSLIDGFFIYEFEITDMESDEKHIRLLINYPKGDMSMNFSSMLLLQSDSFLINRSTYLDVSQRNNMIKEEELISALNNV